MVICAVLSVLLIIVVYGVFILATYLEQETNHTHISNSTLTAEIIYGFWTLLAIGLFVVCVVLPILIYKYAFSNDNLNLEPLLKN
jgi:hypothetical protein